MMRPLAVGFVFSLLGFGIALSQSASAAAPNEDAILSQARQAYYSLHKEGLVSFSCMLLPDWRVMTKKMGIKGQKEKAVIDNLRQLHFAMTFAPNGTITTTHNKPNWTGKKLEALNAITLGMQQTVSGVFATWKSYALDPGLPLPGGSYHLISTGSQYELFYKDGKSDVHTTLGPDFAIRNVTVTAAEFVSSIQPTFMKTKKGFVMIGYTANYKSHNPAETSYLDIAFRDRLVQGFTLIQWMHIDAVYGGSPYAIDLRYANCRVTRKP